MSQCLNPDCLYLNPLILSDRPFPEWTVAQANDIMYNRCCDPDVKSQLATCPLLSANWQEKLLNSLY